MEDRAVPGSRRESEVHEMAKASDNNRRIDYVEMGVTDIERSKRFYGSAFGWTFKDYGPDYCEFADGRLTGGFTTLSPVRLGGPLVILYADDLEGQREAIGKAGGKISQDIYSFPGGRRFHFTDPDGYELAVWSKA
jgi:predicted enzyme related to lactoylglutathione lyase